MYPASEYEPSYYRRRIRIDEKGNIDPNGRECGYIGRTLRAIAMHARTAHNCTKEEAMSGEIKVSTEELPVSTIKKARELWESTTGVKRPPVQPRPERIQSPPSSPPQSQPMPLEKPSRLPEGGFEPNPEDIIADTISTDDYRHFQESEGTAADLGSLILAEQSIAKGERPRGTPIMTYVGAVLALAIGAIIAFYIFNEIILKKKGIPIPGIPSVGALVIGLESKLGGAGSWFHKILGWF